MDISRLINTDEEKLRIIQEFVPGKQVTIAHVIAKPEKTVYQKLGLDPKIDYAKSAIGILTMTPSESAIIGGDLAMKASNVEVGFIDRFSGTLIMTGKISEVETAIREINSFLKEKLGFDVCEITRT